MVIRRVRNKERQKAGNIYCSFCRPEKVDAVWRRQGLFCSHKDGYACNLHKELIYDDRDDHLTEADYQTWMRV